jgi:hypothetical protein
MQKMRDTKQDMQTQRGMNNKMSCGDTCSALLRNTVPERSYVKGPVVNTAL